MATKKARATKQPVKRGEARERLRAAARELIIKHGMDGTSIRAINAAAGVSPGILHYHFGSLEELVVELIGRHMEPLMQERLRLLRECRANGQTTPHDLATVLILPLAELAVTGGEEGIGHVRLLARLFTDRSPLLEQAEQRWTHEFNEELFSALKQCVPGTPEHELALRLDLASHAFLRGLTALGEVHTSWQTRRGVVSGDHWERIRVIVDFVSAGLGGSNPRNA